MKDIIRIAGSITSYVVATIAMIFFLMIAMILVFFDFCLRNVKSSLAYKTKSSALGIQKSEYKG